MLHITPVRNLLRHLQVVHWLVRPLAMLSVRLALQLCVFVCSKILYLANHFWMESAGRTLLRKQILDFKWPSVGYWLYREWATFDYCSLLSTRAHTSRLMSGGVILASRYMSSTLVALENRLLICIWCWVLNPVHERDGISPSLVLHIQRRNNIQQALWFWSCMPLCPTSSLPISA